MPPLPLPAKGKGGSCPSCPPTVPASLETGLRSKLLNIFFKAPMVPTTYTVPTTCTYTQGMDKCAEKKQRLCTLKEICPDGKEPATGNFNVDTWVRILDRKNDWVQVGMWGRLALIRA